MQKRTKAEKCIQMKSKGGSTEYAEQIRAEAFILAEKDDFRRDPVEYWLEAEANVKDVDSSPNKIRSPQDDSELDERGVDRGSFSMDPDYRRKKQHSDKPQSVSDD